MRVLITGITGMAGSHLAEYLLGQGFEVFGTYRWRSRMDNLEDMTACGRVNHVGDNGPIANVASLGRLVDERIRPADINLIEADLTDAVSMRRVVGAIRPDRIFHLAAQSFVPTSWNAPADTLETNIIGQVKLLEAVREAGIDPLIHIAGSSEEYGMVHPNEVPIKETNPLRPLSPYAVSKVAQEMLAFQYFYSYGLRCVVTRAFNHEGPRRGHVFVTSSMAKQIAAIEKGLQPPVIRVGDTSIQRDWTDVRDMVRAYHLVLEKGTPGQVYNIGRGETMTVQAMLDIILSLSEVPIKVEQDPARFRPSDVRLLHADCSKFKQETGWEPEIPFRQTLQDLLDYWRKRV